MSNHRCYINNKGFSLLEVTVALGIASILIIGSTKMLLYQKRGFETVLSKYERTSLIAEIREELSNPLSCLATLGGKDPNNTAFGAITKIIRVRGEIDNTQNKESEDASLSDIELFISNTDEKIAESYSSEAVKFLGFRLTTADSNLSNIPASTTGITHLSINTVTPEGTYVRNTLKTIRVSITTDVNKKVTSCATSFVGELSLGDVCSAFGGQFYYRGKDGIGGCINLSLTSGMTINGKLGIYSSTESVQFINITGVDIFFPIVHSGEKVTTRSFCHILGGRYIKNGRSSGVDDCKNIQLRSSLSLQGNFKITGNNSGMDLFPLGAKPPVNGASSASSKASTIEQICLMLGGTFNATGRKSKWPDCNKLNLNSGMSIENNISAVLSGLIFINSGEIVIE